MNLRTSVLSGWDSRRSKTAQLWDKASCQVCCHRYCKAKGTRYPREKWRPPPGRKDHCDPPKPKAQWQRPGHTQGTKGGVPLFAQGVQERSRSLLEALFCSSAQLQVKKDEHLHLYLIVVEVAVNRKPVRFHFCSCYHGELGPLPYSCSITDRPGQGSTVMFLLALGLQSAAFVTWITWTKWNKWNRISILYSCTTLLANTNTGRRLVVEEFILFYIFAGELGMGTWQKAVSCLQWTQARVCYFAYFLRIFSFVKRQPVSTSHLKIYLYIHAFTKQSCHYFTSI